ncbi:zinc metalloprotease [Alteriqipengyuania lutimaris]|uniref:Peptidase M50 n=1 Tax=Alteriqipengyuania lutimaris TaxID=1538146 RepID=A0A395LJU6_9SPHN|nr:hypothetical protein [Alteriqipengyuania lutimaris]MBB3034120.1 hypothetical protein [Alteriqipengyuania lutimaris]RDS76949.1 hypothetical protein DL238_04545 [Alteriqipengyuania lutimaris]
MLHLAKQVGLTAAIVLVCNALHEIGHLVAAKALGYEAAIRINSVSLVGGAQDWRDAALVDAAGPLVTVLLAIIGVALSKRGGTLGPTIVFAALMMRILATAVSVQAPNDEARISEALGLGTWGVPAMVVGLLAILMLLSARRSAIGWRWLLGAWIGASLGFVVVVFGEPHLPALTV